MEQAEYYDRKFRDDPELCRGSLWQLRNKEVVAWLSNIDFTRVLELAAGSGQLAGAIMHRYPGVKHYLCTDFSPTACGLARSCLSKFKAARVEVLDAVKDLSLVSWDRFDLFICMSLEHLDKGDDLEIIKRVPKGGSVLLGMATFPLPDSDSHPHPYPSRKYVHDRFDPYLHIYRLEYFAPLDVYLLYGVKK